MSAGPRRWLTTTASRARFGGAWVFRRTYDNGSSIVVRVGDPAPTRASRRLPEEQRALSAKERALQIAAADFANQERDAGMGPQERLTSRVFEGVVEAQPSDIAPSAESERTA
jgi:hypothetical protein